MKREILKKLKDKLSVQYADDVISIDESIPSLFSMVDSRRMMEILGKAR